MKTFKIKDLVVSLDTDSVNAAAQPHCGGASLCGTPTNLCHLPSVICQAPTNLCHLPTLCHVPTLCHLPTLCLNHTIITCGGGCSFNPCSHIASLITPTTITWETTTPVQTVLTNLPQNELSEFKAHLADLQKHVDKKLEGDPEELDELEKKLNEAIEEVRAQKANLKKDS